MAFGERDNFEDEDEEKLEEDIMEKLDAAAKLINEAAELADQRDRSLRELYDETRELMKSLGNGGWSTSSMRC